MMGAYAVVVVVVVVVVVETTKGFGFGFDLLGRRLARSVAGASTAIGLMSDVSMVDSIPLSVVESLSSSSEVSLEEESEDSDDEDEAPEFVEVAYGGVEALDGGERGRVSSPSRSAGSWR